MSFSGGGGVWLPPSRLNLRPSSWPQAHSSHSFPSTQTLLAIHINHWLTESIKTINPVSPLSRKQRARFPSIPCLLFPPSPQKGIAGLSASVASAERLGFELNQRQANKQSTKSPTTRESFTACDNRRDRIEFPTSLAEHELRCR